MGRNVAIFGFLAAAILLLPTNFAAAETSFKEMFTDPADGAFDMSRFIKTRTGSSRSWRPSPSPRWGTGSREGSFISTRRKESRHRTRRRRGEPPDSAQPHVRWGLGHGKRKLGSVRSPQRGLEGGPDPVPRRDGVRIPAAHVLRHRAADIRHLPRHRTQDGAVPPGSRRADPRERLLRRTEIRLRLLGHHAQAGEGHPRRHRPGVDGEFEDRRADPVPRIRQPGQLLYAKPGHPREGVPGVLRPRSSAGTTTTGNCTPRPSGTGRCFRTSWRDSAPTASSSQETPRSTPSPSSSCGESRRYAIREPTC